MSGIKNALRNLVPGLLLEFKRNLWGPRARQRRLEVAHRLRNAGLCDDEICIRDGVVLKLHVESREPFEAFCFRFPNMVTELDRFLELSSGKRCFLDIGALHGVFSLMFLATGADRQAVAVDASPVAFQRLQWNVRVNRMRSLQAVECALSSKSGTLKMHFEWEHAVAAGTSDQPNSIVVVSKTGDELCDEMCFCPDVIKIDVEGHELKVLVGLSSIITRMRPLIFLELHPQRVVEEGDSLEVFSELLERLRYTVVDMRGAKFDRRRLVELRGDERLVLLPR